MLGDGIDRRDADHGDEHQRDTEGGAVAWGQGFRSGGGAAGLE